MRFIWEESDIKQGRHLIRQSSQTNTHDKSFALSVAYKVGFIPGGGGRCLIALSDGLVVVYEDKAALVKHLNEDEYGFRPLEGDALIALIKYHDEKRRALA